MKVNEIGRIFSMHEDDKLHKNLCLLAKALL
jgi:hypothetical protein